MKLYNANLSPYASRARLAVYATGLNIEIVPPPAQLGSDAYKQQVNPIGKVPALGLDDGTVIPESDVIVQYIDEKSGGKLSPATPEGRAKARLMGRIADLYIQPGLGIIFRQLGPSPDPARVAEGVAEAKKGLALLEHYVEAGPYAIGGKVSHGDCMIVPTLFFINAVLPRAGEAQPFAATPKLGAYWVAVQKDANVARVLKEMAEALAERMNRT
jgi:glutathione S-transferase